MDIFQRSISLLGQELFHRLNNLTVLVVGVGGVGGYAVESLTRLGIGHLILVDQDCVDVSNCNRQIIATSATIGQAKVDLMKKRILEINPQAQVTTYQQFFDGQEHFFENKIDYVIDAIDTLACKWKLIRQCLSKKIPFISCTGMGNRMNPSKIEITTLDKTSVDPVCRKLREFAKKDQVDMKRIAVVYSSELPVQNFQLIEEGATIRKKKLPPSSIVLTPAVAGIYCSYFVLNHLIKSANTAL